MAITKTPNAALNLIPFDEQPWDEDANENTSIIDGILGQFFSIPNFVGVWKNSTNYAVPQTVIDAVDGTQWVCNIAHASANSPTAFSADRTANPTYWTSVGASSAANAASAAASAASAANSAAQQGQNVGRNLLHNSMFRVAQRGLGPWTTNGAYTADRWKLLFNLDAVSVSIGALLDVSRTQIGDETAEFYLGHTFTGNASAAAYSSITQPIEDVRKLAGKTVVISFWGAASSAGIKLGINVGQDFGTGGSPSTFTQALATGLSVTLGTTFVRYSVSLTLPSIIGKTLGTNKNDSNILSFYSSSGITNNQICGNIGVQAGTIYLWGVQLEIGSVATLLEMPDLQQDFAKCMRFYQTGQVFLASYQQAGFNIGSQVSFIGLMRAAPTIVYVGTSLNNVSSLNVTQSAPFGFDMYGPVTASGFANISSLFTASADL